MSTVQRRPKVAKYTNKQTNTQPDEVQIPQPDLRIVSRKENKTRPTAWQNKQEATTLKSVGSPLATYVHQLVPSVDAKVQFYDHIWAVGRLCSTYWPQ
jgi:hypothetical protein